MSMVCHTDLNAVIEGAGGVPQPQAVHGRVPNLSHDSVKKIVERSVDREYIFSV